MQTALFTSSWDGVNSPHEIWTSALKPQLCLPGQIWQNKRSRPRKLVPYADVYGHVALLLEGHLSQASQTMPQDSPVKRSLCSSGQACSLQSKFTFPLCYFCRGLLISLMQGTHCRRLLFSLMTIVQSSTVPVLDWREFRETCATFTATERLYSSGQSWNA